MSETKTAQVFRAKYSIAYGAIPVIQKGDIQKQTTLYAESVNGEVVIINDYSYLLPKHLDSLGIVYAIRQTEKVIDRKETDPEYQSQVKALAKELSSADLEMDCRVGWDGDIILETPTNMGSSTHIIRRKSLESFLKKWNIDFTVECFTVHSDTVCRLA